MNERNIINFSREHPDKDFPAYHTLSEEECKKIENIFLEKLKLPVDASGLDLVKRVYEKAAVIEGIDAESDNFNLKEILLSSGVSSNKNVYINWHRFDDIDQIGIDDLTVYFDDIWYPAADSIIVFDASFLWILQIGYQGDVSLLMLDE